MERHKPLVRKTALKRTAPQRTPAPVKTVRTSARPATTSSRRTGPKPTLRSVIHHRDSGRCIRCGDPATNIQHRRGRGMGGSQDEDVNRPSLLLSVCGSGTTGCHGWMESKRDTARIFGYAIRRNAVAIDPETVPVLTVDGWQLFLDDATRVPCAPPEGLAA